MCTVFLYFFLSILFCVENNICNSLRSLFPCLLCLENLVQHHHSILWICLKEKYTILQVKSQLFILVPLNLQPQEFYGEENRPQ